MPAETSKGTMVRVSVTEYGLFGEMDSSTDKPGANVQADLERLFADVVVR